MDDIFPVTAGGADGLAAALPVDRLDGGIPGAGRYRQPCRIAAVRRRSQIDAAVLALMGRALQRRAHVQSGERGAASRAHIHMQDAVAVCHRAAPSQRLLLAGLFEILVEVLARHIRIVDDEPRPAARREEREREVHAHDDAEKPQHDGQHVPAGEGPRDSVADRDHGALLAHGRAKTDW